MDTERTTRAEASLAEFRAAAEAMNAGMSEMVTSALRIQMLMLEDAQNMMAEMTDLCAAAARAQGGHRTKWRARDE